MLSRRALAALALLVTLAMAGPARASFINYAAKEINIKIVYVGPNAAANVATLRYFHDRVAPEARGKLVELATNDGKVIFFDFAPKKLGTIRGFKIRFHLYTIDGPNAPATRRLLLKGADGAVFVADARPSASRANNSATKNFASDLSHHGVDIGTFPVVVQLDAFGAKNTVDADAFRRSTSLGSRSIVVADSAKGRGTFDALKAIGKLTLLELKKSAAREQK